MKFVSRAATIALLASAAGCSDSSPDSRNEAVSSPEARVTGIGGIFFKTEDPTRTRAWYRDHLGIDIAEEWGGFAFQWTERDRPDQTGYTVWGSFPDSSDYFAPGEQSFMINYRVANLTALIASLEAEGVEVVGEIQEHPNGKFAWVLDSEGHKVELWEPIDSDVDPYLELP